MRSKEKRKNTTFTMRMPLEIHEFLEKYAEDSFTSMSNIIIQLLIKFKKDETAENDE